MPSLVNPTIFRKTTFRFSQDFSKRKLVLTRWADSKVYSLSESDLKEYTRALVATIGKKSGVKADDVLSFKASKAEEEWAAHPNKSAQREDARQRMKAAFEADDTGFFDGKPLKDSVIKKIRKEILKKEVCLIST